jgi:hypothetical protein
LQKNDAYPNIHITNKAVHEMKSRIVEVYPNLQKTILKKAGINAGFSKDTALSIIKIKTKSQQIKAYYSCCF